MNKLSKTRTFFLFHEQTVLTVLLVFIIFVTLFFVYRTIVLASTVLDSKFSEEIRKVDGQRNVVVQQMEEKKKEYAVAKEKYEDSMEQLVPSHISTDMVVRSLDSMIMYLGSNIVLTSVKLNTEQKKNVNDIIEYPVSIQLSTTKEKLYELLQLIQNAGEMDIKKGILEFPSGETFILPFMTIGQVAVEGDLADQYDATGNPLSPLVDVTIQLYFYSQQ